MRFSLFLLIGIATHAHAVEAVVTLELLDRVIVSPSVDGVIDQMVPREGDIVRRDQIVVRLRTGRFDRQLDVVESELEALVERAEDDSAARSAVARQRSASFNVRKLNEVTERGIRVPALEMTRAKADLVEAAADADGARATGRAAALDAETKRSERELLRFDLEQTEITSPYDGAVIEVTARSGEFVQRGEPMLEIYRLDKLAAVALLDASEIDPAAAVGTRGRFVLDRPGGAVVSPSDAADSETETGNGGSAWPAVIVRVLPRVDVDGKYRAIFELDNPPRDDGRWTMLPGMTGRLVTE